MTRFITAALLASTPFLGGRAAKADSIWTNYTAVAIGTESSPGATPTGGNISTTSDITGTAFATGSISGNTFTLGQDLPSNYNPSAYSLTVLGDVANHINMNEGSALVGANPISGSLGFNEGGAGLVYDSAINPVLPNLGKTMFSEVTAASNAFTNMTATGSVTGSGTTYNLTYSGSGVAVFKLNFANISLQNLNLNLSAFANGATSVVIDVTGLPSGFNFGNTNFEGEFGATDASKILWNFEDYSSTISTSREFYGSILAPDAVLTNGNAIDGSVWVQSIDANGEIHYKDSPSGPIVQYNGFDPLSGPAALSVPEPPTIVLTGLGAIGAVIIAVRKNRKSKPPIIPATVRVPIDVT